MRLFKPPKRTTTVIDRAIRLIEQGWCRGSDIEKAEDGSLRVCVRGALRLASGDELFLIHELYGNASSPPNAAFIDAYDAVNQVAGRRCGASLTVFNDDLARNRRSVISVLREARKALTAK
ncbi:MAG: DUF6197 family protein [Nitriliruptorales bacterium]